MKIKILRFNKIADCHEAIKIHDDNTKIYVDMTTNGDFIDTLDDMNAEEMESFNNSLIGKTFEVDLLDPYMFFACGVEEVK